MSAVPASALLALAIAVVSGGCEIAAGIKHRPLRATGGAGGQGGVSGLGGQTAMAGRGGAGGGATGGGGAGAGGPALGSNGEPCPANNTRACDGQNPIQKLLCSGTTWIANGECPSGQRCDSRQGATAGTCAPILAACAQKQPGDRVCVGTEVHTCGRDLVTTERALSCDHPTPECQAGVCICTGMMCNGLCADLTSNRNHCGRCEHACEGECVGSRCRLVLATRPLATPAQRNIVVDAAHIYWTHPDDGSVMKVGLDGGDAIVLATTGDAGGGAIAIDATRVYWLTQNAVWSAPKTAENQAATQLNMFMGGSSIAVDATSVYFTGCCTTSRLMRMTLDGSNRTELATVGAYAGGVGVRGDSVFWTEASVPWKTVVGSGTKTMAITSVAGAAYRSGLIAINATSLFWVVNGPVTVMRAGLDLGNPQTLVMGGSGIAAGSGIPSIVVDGDGIYWTGMGVKRAGLDGQGVTTLASDLSAAGGIAVDATSVYVTTTSGQIVKIEK